VFTASAKFPLRSAIQVLPQQQAGWVAASMATAGGLSMIGLWTREPELALAVSMGCGAAAIHPRRVWALPLVTLTTLIGGWISGAAEIAPVLGAGAVLGVWCAWLALQQPDWLDAVNGALGTAAGSTLGLWVAQQLLPLPIDGAARSMLTAGLVGLIGSQALLPLALRFDTPKIPSLGQIRRTLQVPYRPPVFRALDLCRAAMREAPDPECRRGLAEVATWVFRLETTLQSLDRELQSIDPIAIDSRISLCEGDNSSDPFTRERRQATVAHLRRLLAHREAIVVEHQRSEALVDYALAFLEEMKAGLAVAFEFPGEAAPERLPDVLERLRSHSAAGDARRRTAREVGRLD
jgi:hypothetical protein